RSHHGRARVASHRGAARPAHGVVWVEAADAPGYGGADPGPAEGRCRGPNRPASQGAVCRGGLAADATHRAPVSARRRVDREPPEERADLGGGREKARLAQKLIAKTLRPAAGVASGVFHRLVQRPTARATPGTMP